MHSMFIRWIDCARFPEVSAIKPKVFKVNSLRDNESKGPKNSKNCTKTSASQVLAYFGVGGLMLKIPLQNLRISGLSFQQCPPSTDTIGSKADFAVLIALNEHPDSNNSVRKVKIVFILDSVKLKWCLIQKTSHFL